MTWHVFEKSIIPKWLKERGYTIPAGDSVDFYGCVFDSESETSIHFKHDDGVWYQRGEPSGLIEMSFMADFGINPSRFIGMNYADCEKYAVSRCDSVDADYVYYVDAGDTEGIVAAMHHALYVRADLDKCRVQEIAPEYVIPEICTISLSDAFRAALGTLSQPPETSVNQVLKLKNQAGMTIKDFATYFGIEYRTVQNWIGNVNRYPEWAMPLFRLKLLSDGRI